MSGADRSAGPSVSVPLAPERSEPEALATILAWWDREQRDLPWRSSRDPYAIWVAEVMSAQTAVLRAADYWTRWMARWPTVTALAEASLGDVLAVWQGLGYPRRARDLHRGAQQVARDGWPASLRELPGVGPYVEAAIRCFAHEEAVLPRDVNVERVLTRRLGAAVPDLGPDPWRTGQGLMEFGQRICRARPDCPSCPVRVGCAGPQTGAEGRPRRQPRFEGSLRQRRGRLLARVLSEGRVPRRTDPAAADGLLSDGLLEGDGEWLWQPGEDGARAKSCAGV